MASKLISDSKRYSFLRFKSKIQGRQIPGELPFSWEESLYNRSAVITKVIRLLDAKSYLEIGCESDVVFKAIDCARKVGVDPDRGGTVRATSDDFFAGNKETFDVIFVDGLHTYQQVRQDLANSFKFLNKNGVVLMHDCLPLNYDEQAMPRQSKSWTGDVWKAAFEIKQNPDIDFRVISIDHGIGIMKMRPNSQQRSYGIGDFSAVNFDFLMAKYRELGLIQYHDIEGFVS